MKTQQFVTKSDLEQILKFHRNTVGRMLAEGKFPNAIKINRRWRIPIEDVEIFVNGTRQDNGQEVQQ